MVGAFAVFCAFAVSESDMDVPSTQFLHTFAGSEERFMCGIDAGASTVTRARVSVWSGTAMDGSAPGLTSWAKRNLAPLQYGTWFRFATSRKDVAVNDSGQSTGSAAGSKRKDARRNRQTLLDAAATAFVTSGVEAPVRDIAAKAGVGMGTIYRHFPTRADLIIAVYRHQIEACAEAGPALLAAGPTPHAALGRWVDLFVDFLVTKHGLAAALHSDNARFETLHAYFLDRLLPVCTQLLDAAAASGEIRCDLNALQLLHGIGNLCIGVESDPGYDARRLVALLVAGLRQPC
jgi:AcrR family transcriptional regulator